MLALFHASNGGWGSRRAASLHLIFLVITFQGSIVTNIVRLLCPKVLLPKISDVTYWQLFFKMRGTGELRGADLTIIFVEICPISGSFWHYLYWKWGHDVLLILRTAIIDVTCLPSVPGTSTIFMPYNYIITTRENIIWKFVVLFIYIIKNITNIIKIGSFIFFNIDFVNNSIVFIRLSSLGHSWVYHANRHSPASRPLVIRKEFWIMASLVIVDGCWVTNPSCSMVDVQRSR